MNSAGVSAAAPWRSVVHRIQDSQTRPNTVASGREDERHDIGDPAACGDRHQCVLPICLLIRSSSSLAIVSTMKVTTNSRKPSAISDER